ncbi:MAG: HAMP domain-containing sensor histidine kinase [Rikenellaceae bacterium]
MGKWNFRNIMSLTLRNRIVFAVGMLLGALSLIYTHNMANSLRDKEQHDVEVWAHAMERLSQDIMGRNDPFITDIVNSNQNIPFVMTDNNLNVIESHLIPEEIINHPDLLRKRIEKLSEENRPIVVRFMWNNDKHILFYGQSTLLKRLYFYPYIQLLAIFIYITLCYVAFTSTKQGEQNRVWVGLAKETAHQLGTPTSSLLGWIEYLKTQPIDPEVVEEMNKDLKHLLKIVDRFSKIGSDTQLSRANVNEVVGESVMYFQTRIPRNVTLDYNGFAMAPVPAMLNSALFEWVIENLLKNSLDALQGQGSLRVKVSTTDSDIHIDVTDSGKGIPKGNWDKIFEPGFSTKTRGWGLGLSLSRRIVEEYHNGKIAVIDSVIGQGTTIRVTLKRDFE